MGLPGVVVSAPFPLPQELYTPRLRLRRPTLDDVPVVYGYASDPEVTRYLSFRTHRDPAEAAGFVQRADAAWNAESGHRPWMIEERATGEAVGAIGMDLDGCRANVGYVLRRASWRQGIVPEALAAVADLAFAFPAIWRLHAWHDVENPASGRVMEKVGMVREACLHRYAVLPNVGPEPRDVYMWARVRRG